MGSSTLLQRDVAHQPTIEHSDENGEVKLIPSIHFNLDSPFSKSGNFDEVFRLLHLLGDISARYLLNKMSRRTTSRDVLPHPSTTGQEETSAKKRSADETRRSPDSRRNREEEVRASGSLPFLSTTGQGETSTPNRSRDSTRRVPDSLDEAGRGIPRARSVPRSREQHVSGRELGSKPNSERSLKTVSPGADSKNKEGDEEKTDEEDEPTVVVIGDNSLKCNKTQLQWRRYGGKKKISVLNNTSTYQALKVKCSDNSIFNVDPPITSISPNETLKVKIHRMHSVIKPDKIVMLTTATARNEQYLHKLFANPFVTHMKVTINQLVEGSYILAYFAPNAPSGRVQCLRFESSKLVFNGRVGGDQNLRIVSTVANRIGVKVQCTDNSIFYFRPVFGIIEPKDSYRIKVSRLASPSKHDKMVLKLTCVGDAEKEANLPSLFLDKGLEIVEICIPLVTT